MKILITGCSKGIGRATASELARRGHEVIASARRPETLEGLAVARRIALDVTDDASVQKAHADVGEVDVLFNNAGEISLAPLESVPFQEVRHLFDLNVFGTLRTIQAFAPAMRARGGGTIVNMSSFVGRFGMPLSGVYCATKHAIESLSESLRFELGHFGVRVVVIEPGAISTGALDAPRMFFEAENPYGELAEQLRFAAVTPPEAVARTVADAIEAPDRQFRWPVGPDAEGVLGARAKLDDAAFDGALRSTLKVQW